MAALIDTNVAIHLRDGSAEVGRRLAELGTQPLLSVVSRAELDGGVAARPGLADYLRRANAAILANLTILDFDQRCADAYRDLVEAVGYSRSRVIDRMIAATAIAHRLTLITINGDDFRDIPGLSLEVWRSPDQ
ncbi:MAG: PIN domain-containing protein [Sphingomonas sp.]